MGASYARQAWHGFVYEEDTRRLERATFDRQATVPTVADLRYSYDDVGNVLSVADVPADLPGNHELQCFQYDDLRRLVESWAQGDTQRMRCWAKWGYQPMLFAGFTSGLPAGFDPERDRLPGSGTWNLTSYPPATDAPKHVVHLHVRELFGQPRATGLNLRAEQAEGIVFLAFYIGDPDLRNIFAYRKCDSTCPYPVPTAS